MDAYIVFYYLKCQIYDGPTLQVNKLLKHLNGINGDIFHRSQSVINVDLLCMVCVVTSLSTLGMRLLPHLSTLLSPP